MLHDIKKSFVPLSLLVCLFSVDISSQELASSPVIKNHKFETDLLISEDSQTESEKLLIEKSIAVNQSDIVKNPKDAVSHNNLGTAYFRLKRFDEAENSIKTAIEVSPRLALPYYNLSVVYDYLGRRDEAISYALQATALDPRNALFVNQLCELSFVAEKFEQAASCYENLKNIAPSNPRIFAKRGISLLSLPDLKKACAELETGVRLFPQDAVLHNTLGIAYFQRKQYKKAVEEFSRAHEIEPAQDMIRFNLALAQLKTNNKEAALKNYFVMKNKDSALAPRLFKLLYADKIVYAGQ